MKYTSNTIPTTLTVIGKYSDTTFVDGDMFVWGEPFEWVPPSSIAGKACILEVKSLYLKTTKTTTSDPGYLTVGLKGLPQVQTYAYANDRSDEMASPVFTEGTRIRNSRTTDIVAFQTTSQAISEWPEIVVQVPQGQTTLTVKICKPEGFIPEATSHFEMIMQINLHPINS